MAWAGAHAGCTAGAFPALSGAKAGTTWSGIFATRVLEKGEEAVLSWEWDDVNAVHWLPRCAMASAGMQPARPIRKGGTLNQRRHTHPINGTWSCHPRHKCHA
ncbi:hypothetical protein B0H10DRAFT_1970024 [Mycena sp. CBHHK59/15]|nr:hypothetical protein B0H10DRAFT_1970024 [Mycena sp. CBHHK59/15]